MAWRGWFGRTLRAHPRRSAATAAVVVLAVGGAILVQANGNGGGASVDPRTRLSANYSACLLTGPTGSTAQPATAVWAGLQQAALSTSERASQQPMLGAQTLENAETSINTLALRQCKTIVAVGALPTEAAALRAPNFPAVSFYLVTDAAPQTKNAIVAVIAPADAAALTASVAHVLEADFAARG